MRRLLPYLCLAPLLVLAPSLDATIFGRVDGIVHDPQHRPLPGASVQLQSVTSDLSQSAKTDDQGAFSFTAVPIGDYKVSVSQAQFQPSTQTVTVRSDTTGNLHFQLALASVSTTATVVGETPAITMESVTPTTLIDRQDIEQTPGADRTNSMAMITDFTPGAYVTHDMLHMRGGHQVDWLIDGVPIANTNIATNLGPQIDPKDIDYLEVQRGSYDAEYGDRTYGVFNIVPRSGFESNNEGTLTTSLGNWYQTNDQLTFGSHTRRFAYYVSLNGNRSDYGLQPPIGQVVHDADNGYGGFASLIFNANASNQLRVVTSLRQDYYQIPIDPNPNSAGNQVYPSAGLHDAEREPDGYVTFTWAHTFNPNVQLTLSPFYHYNAANYLSSPSDTPVITNVNQTANYAGGQANLQATVKKNDMEAGFYGFVQHQHNYFNNIFTDCAPDCTNYGPSSDGVTGGAAEVFFSDRYKVTSWLTLIAGFRFTHFDSGSSASSGQPALIENAPDPRFGVATPHPANQLGLSRFLWRVLPAASAADRHRPAARFRHQPEPDLRLRCAGSAITNTSSASPFRSTAGYWKRTPFKPAPETGWTTATLASRTFSGRSPGTAALIQGWETTLRSPRLWRIAQAHVAYSNQIAQAVAPFTGGLICPTPRAAPVASPRPDSRPSITIRETR